MTRFTRFVSSLFSLILLAGLLAGLAETSLPVQAAPQAQAAASVVIGEFRARGPNGGDDEFIELYNPTVDPVDISGWSIKTSNASGQTVDITTIPPETILVPGQHYLIADFADYSGLVKPDRTYLTGGIPNDGGIAVFNASQATVDAVGMSAGSAYKENPPLSPWPSNDNSDRSYERKTNSCEDSNQNSLDFQDRIPSDPQNSGSTRILCGNPVLDTFTTITGQTPSVSVVGQPVTVQFSVVAAGGGVPNGGTVTVTGGATSCSSGLDANGQGECSLTFFNAGPPKSLTATYAGHDIYGRSVSNTVSYQVDPAETRTTIMSHEPNPSFTNQSVTIHFKVEVQPPGAGNPPGDVTVNVGAKSCTGSLTKGEGQCSLAFETPGQKILTASYAGTSNFKASTSAQRTHSVQVPPNTSTPTSTNPPTSSLSVIINEIAWMGTNALATDEWIELYNTTSSAINLAGWRLRTLDAEPNIVLTGVIPARGYYLLERRELAVSDIDADQIYSGALSDTGERLYLYNASNFIVDYANTYSTTWLAGSITNNRSMERRAVVVDSRTSWVTNMGVVRNGKDANNAAINGTPKRQNWAFTVTLTPSPRPTLFPTRTQPPQPRPVINEFLPRADFDWNQDGKVDVFDEFIEVANLGPVDVNLRGWRLDDEANSGSNLYTLPDRVLKPGERALFFGLQSNILLSDGGDTVRLLSPTGVIFDAQTYPVVKVADQSWCRLPDLRGSWFPDCFPTPNAVNERRGQIPSLPPGTGLEEPLCRLADTLPEEFILAECRSFGANMWSASYWDMLAPRRDLPVHQNGSKWEIFVE
jgi:hypothetical protein